MSLVSGEFESWDRSMELDDVCVDSAAPGKSPERVSVRRQLLVECSALGGLVAVQLLWDLEAFYDSINIAQLLPDVRRWGLPEVPAALALQLHVAPRALQVHGCFAPLISAMGSHGMPRKVTEKLDRLRGQKYKRRSLL